ncbi:MAG: hypothetical protein AB4042_02040 [Leptolyngbyaceae cyanobacterium]
MNPSSDAIANHPTPGPSTIAPISNRGGQSPTLPSLPKRKAGASQSRGSRQGAPTVDGSPEPEAMSSEASPPESSWQPEPSDPQGAIADLRQSLDIPLESSIFEASILDQLDRDPLDRDPLDRDPLDCDPLDRDLSDSESTQAWSTTSTPSRESIPDMVPDDLRRRRLQRQRRSPFTGLAWPILWMLMLLGVGGVGSVAFLWMTSLPPRLDCQELSPLSADAQRLHCASVAATSGQVEDVLAGFNLVRPWSSNHPLFHKAQEAMANWTQEILAVAESTLYSKGLTEALAWLDTVPTTSPLYDDVEGKRQEWQGLWDRGEAIEQIAMAAVQAKKWDVAAQQVVEMGKLNHPYWRQDRANTLSLRVVAERQGAEAYQAAQDMAIAATPEALAAALTELQTIQPQTFAWKDAQLDLAQWSKAIAQESQQRFQAGDIEGMLTLAQALPPTPELMPQINDLMKLGYAQRQATDDPENWTPGLAPVTEWMMAITTAAQIEADSPLYEYTQTQMAVWQQQLQDLAQLQLAQAIASTGHRTALQLAIHQASLVDKGQPRRIQAQTLIADWQQAIERVEDRADLALAHQMAAPGTLAALARAIAQAETIQPNRALRQDADEAIAQWVTDMQVIEDQPILDRAAALATGGNWQGAIAEAQTIGRDRALHPQAQAQIGNWQAAIVAAEHRAVLARARSLAAQVRLTAAINLANSIPASSTSVYREAQGAIAQWSRERDRIWATRNQTPSPAPSPASSATVSRPAPRSTPTPSPQPSGNFEGYYDSRYYDYYGN